MIRRLFVLQGERQGRVTLACDNGFQVSGGHVSRREFQRSAAILHRVGNACGSWRVEVDQRAIGIEQGDTDVLRGAKAFEQFEYTGLADNT